MTPTLTELLNKAMIDLYPREACRLLKRNRGVDAGLVGVGKVRGRNLNERKERKLSREVRKMKERKYM